MADETQSGIMSGVAAGSMFGPVGMIVGGAIGGFMGGKAKKKRREAERQMLIANTKMSYEIGEGSVSGMAKSRSNIATSYTANLAQERARIVASGGSLEGDAWKQAQGSVAIERDRALDAVATEREAYEASDAYGFIKRDYDAAFGAAGTGISVTGEDFYTEEQRADMRDYAAPLYTGDPDAGDSRTVAAAKGVYRESVAMSLDEFELSRFGTDEQKAEMEGITSTRITEANKVYDDFLAMEELARLERSNASMGYDY